MPVVELRSLAPNPANPIPFPPEPPPAPPDTAPPVRIKPQPAPALPSAAELQQLAALAERFQHLFLQSTPRVSSPEAVAVPSRRRRVAADLPAVPSCSLN